MKQPATKLILAFFALLVYAMGVIGGIGNLLYDGHYLFAVCSLAVGVMAFPTAKNFFGEFFK